MRHAAQRLGNSKVHDLRHILGHDHDVRRLDVAMDDITLTCVIQTSGDLFCNFHNLIARKNALLGHK